MQWDDILIRVQRMFNLTFNGVSNDGFTMG